MNLRDAAFLFPVLPLYRIGGGDFRDFRSHSALLYIILWLPQQEALIYLNVRSMKAKPKKIRGMPGRPKWGWDVLGVIKTLHIGTATPEVAELLDFLQDMFWVKDPEGRYCFVNVPFLLNFSLKDRSEIIGKTDFDFFDQVLANQYRIDDERVLRGTRIISRIELVGRFNHTARWCVTSKIPLRDKTGKIVGTAGVTREAQDHARLNRLGDSPLSAAIHYISQHYGDRIYTSELAKISGLSTSALHRQFLSAYKCSPHVYIRQLRIRMSCNTLVYSRKSIAAIASEFGFADQSHFTREFSRVMGETPSSYRAHYQG